MMGLKLSDYKYLCTVSSAGLFYHQNYLKNKQIILD